MLQMEAQGNLAFGCCSTQEGLSNLKLPGSLVTRLVRGGKLVGLQGTVDGFGLAPEWFCFFQY